MLFEKTSNKYKFQLIALFIFVILFYATRMPRLDTDIINPDGVNWHFRSEQFVVALKQKIFENTYQHYHPGVSLMWLTGIPIEVLKQITDVKIYDQFTFEAFDYVAKFFVVNSHLVLLIVSIFLLTRIIHFWPAYIISFILMLEPFFVGNSRLYHLDVLLALLLFLGLLALWKSYISDKLIFPILAGSVFALSFLTKSVAIGALIFSLIFFGIVIVRQADKRKQFFKHALGFLLSYIVTLFLFFPALWVKPVETMTSIFSEAERVGGRKGHGQIVLGEYTRDAGPGFYPLVLVMKLTPFAIIGILFYVILFRYKVKYSGGKGFNLFLGVFYLGYFVGMSVLSKKIDRYMIIMFPYLCYMSVLGYGKLLEFTRTGNLGVVRPVFLIVLFAVVTLFTPLFTYFPYYFTYTSPLFGTPENANKILAQKPFGVGIHDLKRFILDNYGYYPRLGFIDTKPMKAIYYNSKIFDIREQKPYDDSLIVLGINEDFIDKSESSKSDFELDSVFRINQLDYWRIFKRK